MERLLNHPTTTLPTASHPPATGAVDALLVLSASRPAFNPFACGATDEPLAGLTLPTASELSASSSGTGGERSAPLTTSGPPFVGRGGLGSGSREGETVGSSSRSRSWQDDSDLPTATALPGSRQRGQRGQPKPADTSLSTLQRGLWVDSIGGCGRHHAALLHLGDPGQTLPRAEGRATPMIHSSHSCVLRCAESSLEHTRPVRCRGRWRSSRDLPIRQRVRASSMPLTGRSQMMMRAKSESVNQLRRK